ncbi:class I SAM-dependent methyltransferase [Paenibacillus sp. S150]|uniref:class I SAM-dependent methyltransferase n=1 Tax=Paenibacillus sp. S150 TaxID=2749826 RepID=UPI001C57C242|nr:methyltransferase domain-containing protein [Paenibacillus sp. S150]MBW4083034.1 methyltransferase domain-containing protein [Paenibacillus sp. S150]
MSERIKEQVQQQFAKNAGKYVSSALHAKGADLELLVSASQAHRDMKVLDIATGGGHVANALAPLVKQVTAYDLTEEMLKSAAAFIQGNGHRNVDFIRGDAEALPFAAASFELVTCRIAAHHFPDIPAFISEAGRVLKPGGRLQLIDNVAPEDKALAGFYNEVEKLRDPSHVRALPKSEWIQLLERSGFRLEALICFAKPFNFADWCERAGLAQPEQERVKAAFLQAPQGTRDFFSIREDGGELLGFTGEAAYMQASKVRPD